MPDEWRLSFYSDTDIRAIIHHTEMKSIIDTCEVGYDFFSFLILIYLLFLLSIHYVYGVKNTFVGLMEMLEKKFDIDLFSIVHCLIPNLVDCFFLSAREMNSRTGSTVKVILWSSLGKSILHSFAFFFFFFLFIL